MQGYAPVRRYVWLTWISRLAILVCLFFGWRFFQSGQYAIAGGAVLLAVLAWWGQDVCRQLALGWVTDDFGERQKVLAADRNGVMHTQDSRQQRQILELHTKAVRHRQLFRQGVGTAVLGGAAYYLYSTNYADYSWFGKPAFWVVLALGCIVGVFFASTLALELLYLSGWQLMTGAKVLDQAPQRTGHLEVQSQMAHGGARLATETELHDAATGKVKQSRLHDESF